MTDAFMGVVLAFSLPCACLVLTSSEKQMAEEIDFLLCRPPRLGMAPNYNRCAEIWPFPR